MGKYWDKNWRRETNSKVKKCFDCRKKIEANEEHYTWWELHADQSASGFDRCVECHEKKISDEGDEYISQVTQLWDDLGDKELNVNEVKRVKKLVSNISQLLEGCKNIKDHLDSLPPSFTLDTLEDILPDLKEHLKEHASPQNIEKAKGKDKNCYHDDIEQHDNIYRCAYCWDSSSELFLKKLKRKGLKQNNPNPPTPNDNPEREQKIKHLKQRIAQLAQKT